LFFKQQRGQEGNKALIIAHFDLGDSFRCCGTASKAVDAPKQNE
jgi:hypothetical protein